MPIAKTDVDIIRKTKVYEKIAHQIQRLIRDGLLKPGDKLPPERELAEMFQVSRSSLRDAIRALELMGLVEPRQGEGTVVLAPSSESLINPLAAALRRAATYASPEDLDLLEAILRRQKEKVDRGELAIEEDSEFHYAIANAAKNSVVLRVLDAFMDLLRESREQSLQVEGRLQKSLAGHRLILQAIQRHDSSAAESAMRRHIEEIEGIVLNKI